MIKEGWQPATSSQSRNIYCICLQFASELHIIGNENRSIYANSSQSGVNCCDFFFFLSFFFAIHIKHFATPSPANQTSQWIETLSYSNGGYIIICELNWKWSSDIAGLWRVLCLPARSIEFSAVRNRIKIIKHSLVLKYASLFMAFL